MLATLIYWNQRCVNRKSIEQELTKLPPHLTVSHPPYLHGPVSMGGELPALTSLSMPVWDDSWSARQQEEIVLLHNSDPWTWFFFFPAPSHTLLPPTPMLLEVIQYKVTLELHTSSWALNPAFATQPKQHQRREFSGKKKLAHASCSGKKKKSNYFRATSSVGTNGWAPLPANLGEGQWFSNSRANMNDCADMRAPWWEERFCRFLAIFSSGLPLNIRS